MCASIENQKVRRKKKHEDIIQFKIEFLLPLTACRKNAWTNACHDVKTKMSDVERPAFVQFCLVLSSVVIVKKAAKNSVFSLFENIRVTVSLGGTFTHMQKPVCLQFRFVKKGKP